MKSCRLALIITCVAILGTLGVKAEGWPANYGGVMLQGFYWDSYDDTKWTNLTSQADELANYFDIIWIPNAARSSGSPSMGYLPIYWFDTSGDHYSSSFGNYSQLTAMLSAFNSRGLNTIMDLVLNHRVGVSNWADFPAETYKGTTYQMDNSCVCRTDEWGRNGGNPTGANDEGDDFDGGRDLDHTSSKVQQHCKIFGDFLLEQGFSGWRLDMVKGYAGYYTKMYNEYSKPRFSVGEYWDSYDNITAWISATNKESAAFDFPLKYALNECFNGDSYNTDKLCWLANGWDAQPAGLIHYDFKQYAVTFVDNHDTGREGNSSRFTGNPLAANAFILCSPGTPCVFLPHWKQYKSEIKKMIAIRKACGVTNTSKVVVLHHGNDYYMAETTGKYGKLVLKIGSAMVSPSGYSDSQIKASGTNWCIWANVDVPTVPGPVDKGEYKVYWDNSSASWSAPKCHYWGGKTSSTWPGVAMTKVSGTQNVYEITVPSGTTGVLFNNGSGTKTDDQAAIENHLYGLSGDKGSYSGGDTTGTGGNQQDDDDNGDTGTINNYVYFDNSVANWSSVYIYYWDSPKNSWPGTPISSYSGNLYRYPVASCGINIIFNKGEGGDSNQTSDQTRSAGHVYTHRYADNTRTSVDRGALLPSDLYVIGSTVNGNSWNTQNCPRLSKSGYTFKGNINLEAASGKDYANFTFIQKLGSTSSDWDTPNSMIRFGSATDNEPITPGTPGTLAVYASDPGAARNWKVEPGYYQFNVNIQDLTINLTPITLSLNKRSLALGTGESETLVATLTPEDISGDVTWSSSDTGVATVSTSGKVTAVANGTATITATYGSLTTTCAVYVGKSSQRILWTQTLTTLGVGSSVNLTATATSGLPVVYTIVSGTNYAHITDGGELVGDAPGVVTIEANQAGDATYSPAETVSKTVTVTLGYISGDASGDDQLTAADVTAVIGYILGTPPDGFNASAADMNGDGVVNVVDITLVVDAIISAGGSMAAPRRAPAAILDSDDMEEFAVESAGNALYVSFTNMEDYVTTQFDIMLPAGCTVTSAYVDGSNHRVSYRKISDNVTRFVVYSLFNSGFASSGKIIVKLSSPANGDVELANALIDSLDGSKITEYAAKGFKDNTLTGISAIKTEAGSRDCRVYTIDGILIYSGSLAGFSSDRLSGVYLIHTAESVQKVHLR